MQLLFSTAPATFMLLLVNIMIGIYTLFVDPSIVHKWSFKPYQVARKKELGGIISGGFLHGGLDHLAFNMITLFFFGPAIEGLLGTLPFLLIYFGSELSAHALTYWKHNDNPKYSAVGASGAISGVLFSFILFWPFELLYLMFAIPIPALLFAVLYVGYSIYASKRGGGFIAHEAHLGGAIGGVLITILVYPDVIRIFLGQLGLG